MGLLMSVWNEGLRPQTWCGDGAGGQPSSGYRPSGDKD